MNNWEIFINFFQSVNYSFYSVFNIPNGISSKEIIEAIQFLIIALGIAISLRKNFEFKKKQANLINFFRFTFILTIFIIFFLFFFKFIEIPIFQSIYNFSIVYIFRLFELFGGYWAVFFVFTFNYFIILIKEGYKKYNKDKKDSKRLNRVFKFSKILSILLFSGFYYITNYTRTEYVNYFSDSQTEVVLFAGNYFYENPLNENTSILLEYIEYTFFYYLIEVNNLQKKYFEFDFVYDLNYSDFKSYFDNYYSSYNSKFGLFFKGNLSSEFNSNLTKDFDLLYENKEGYVFVKIKE
ncbi:MAG: hypothetical protein ACFE85_03890 [Candidatus Hodarchaeota archaeon]